MRRRISSVFIDTHYVASDPVQAQNFSQGRLIEEKNIYKHGIRNKRSDVEKTEMEKLWEFSVNARSFELKDIEAALSEIQVNPLIVLNK